MNGAADRAGFSFLQIAGHHSGLLPEKRCILVIVNLQEAAGGGQRSLKSLLQFVELFLLSVEVFYFGKQLCEFLFAIACIAQLVGEPLFLCFSAGQLRMFLF